MNNIIEESRLWLNKEQDGLDLNTCKEFEIWINTSALHKKIFEEEKDFRESILDLPKNILDELSFNNQKEIKQDAFLIKIKKVSLSAALFCLIIFASYFTYNLYTPSFQNTYITTNTINKNIILPDSSILALNKNSQIDVIYYKDKREVHLIKGKVLFHVSSNKNRPFIIKINSTLVEVIGTKFEIVKLGKNIKVSVVEGKVSIKQILTNNSRSKILAILQKSDSIEVNDFGEITKLIQINEKTIAIWEKEKLLFEQTSLKNVVKEFSKYLNYKVSIEDKSLESLLISGEFSINDFENLMKSLSVIHPLSVDKIDDTYYIKKKL